MFVVVVTLDNDDIAMMYDIVKVVLGIVIIKSALLMPMNVSH